MMAASKPSSVLFACNLNTVRSPLAAALVRRRVGSTLFVESCGLYAGGEIDAFARVVAEEAGLDLANHRPKSFDELDAGGFDLIISLTAEARERAATLARGHAVELDFWPLSDPSVEDGSRDQRLDAYRAMRRALQTRIEARF